MKWKVLVSSRSIQRVVDRFRPLFEEHNIEIILPAVRERLSEEELFQLAQDVDGVICGDDYFTERVLRAAKRLKVISKWGTGIDSINQRVCQELGIVVCNTPNAFTDPVADTVLAYILNHARQIKVLDEQMRGGIWQKHPAVSLREQTLGVIGIGDIGRAVIRRASAFGMKILAYDIAEIPNDFIKETKAAVTTRELLLRQADFISLNCDLNEGSHYMISDRELSLMKKTAYVINTARGPLIDEAALIRALHAQQIAGAALDVFEEEPLGSSSPLRALPNVLLAPHNANASTEAHERVHLNTIHSLLKVLDTISIVPERAAHNV